MRCAPWSIMAAAPSSACLLVGVLSCMVALGLARHLHPSYMDTNSVVSCPHGCMACSAVNGCLACKPPYFLSIRRYGFRQTATCTKACPVGFYKLRVKKQGVCARCLQTGCAECRTEYYCAVCKPGFLHQSGKCTPAPAETTKPESFIHNFSSGGLESSLALPKTPPGRKTAASSSAADSLGGAKPPLRTTLNAISAQQEARKRAKSSSQATKPSHGLPPSVKTNSSVESSMIPPSLAGSRNPSQSSPRRSQSLTRDEKRKRRRKERRQRTKGGRGRKGKGRRGKERKVKGKRRKEGRGKGRRKGSRGRGRRRQSRGRGGQSGGGRRTRRERKVRPSDFGQVERWVHEEEEEEVDMSRVLDGEGRQEAFHREEVLLRRRHRHGDENARGRRRTRRTRPFLRRRRRRPYGSRREWFLPSSASHT
ncbi:uncharacterized protein LOC143021776 [Oratosquilla oratoria]|uniref:uncharacterized protein LOC143021776 n=1 Tax=Oratosquilla oratoria TaxID=337810 RepID=UPI003F7620AF